MGSPPSSGPDKRKPAVWLTGERFLPTKALSKGDICEGAMGIVEEKKFKFAPKPNRFTPPMVLIGETEALPSLFWNKGYITFLHDLISVNAPPSDEKELKLFSDCFERNKKEASALCLLKSPRALVGKSTSILKSDIDNIPWPNDDGGLKLSWWEAVLLDDVLDHMSKLIRVGQNAPVLTKAVDNADLDNYASLFTKLLGSVYRNLRSGKSDCFDGLAYQAFYFGEQCDLDWPDDWSDKLTSVVHKSNSAIHTSRVIRFYDENTLIIVKPDRLRHWIPSTAIRDADETLVELQQQGF